MIFIRRKEGSMVRLEVKSGLGIKMKYKGDLGVGKFERQHRQSPRRNLAF